MNPRLTTNLRSFECYSFILLLIYYLGNWFDWKPYGRQKSFQFFSRVTSFVVLAKCKQVLNSKELYFISFQFSHFTFFGISAKLSIKLGFRKISVKTERLVRLFFTRETFVDVNFEVFGMDLFSQLVNKMNVGNYWRRQKENGGIENNCRTTLFN